MIIKKLDVEKFRGLKDFSLSITSPVNIIVGQNGTMKTTLLGILAQPFSTKTSSFAEETRIDGYKFGSQLSENFKFSKVLDKPGEHKWSVTVNKKIYAKEVFTCLSEQRSDNSAIRFWSTEGRAKGMNYIQCPVVYLSLKRLVPIGEEKKLDSTSIILSDAEKEYYIRKYKEILISPDDDVQSIKQLKGSSKSTVVPQTKTYDEFTVSAGQDNVGKIILSVLSMSRLKEKYKEEYKGGIILIDELETTLYPAAQEKVCKFMFEAAEKYNLQFFCTTHSFEVIKYIKTGQFKERGSIFYLKKSGEKLMCYKNPSLPEIENDLNIAVGRTENITKVKIYCEDDVACTFLAKLLPKQIKPYIKVMKNVNLSWGSYKTFYKEGIPEFTENIVCLDGDVRHDPNPKNRWANCPTNTNIVFLPGEFSLEKLTYNFLYSKPEEDPFWDNSLSGYSKQACFRDFPSKLTDTDNMKQWFKSQKEHAGNGYVKFINAWKKANEQEIQQFQKDIVRAYNFIADKKGLSKISLDDSSTNR